jgi:hypothetical protein
MGQVFRIMQNKGFLPYRTGCTLSVLNVFNVGHPAEGLINCTQVETRLRSTVLLYN